MLQINHSPSDFKNGAEPDRAVAKEGDALSGEFLHLGCELHSRGSRPTAEFWRELADLPEAHEILQRLRDFSRLSIAQYAAVGADRFPVYLVPVNGGRK